ncbi:MAG: LacI family transcriptional regulator, partial [Arthrobacter sp.]|nr:LacI family transcriptional regulator [Arthrobacter sp.]
MEDVASLAGVSHQTVSRVLNAHPNVTARTRARVERAIAELGYRPNTAARSLVTRQSLAIGVLAAGTAQYGPANTLLGVQQAARNEGYLAVPLVAVGFSADERLTVVAVNQRAGAALAVEHLVNLGHTAIAHISGPRDWIDAAARADGWRRTLQQAGLRAAALTEGDWSAESGYLAGLELAAAGNVTAVFAANDQMALGALRAFGEAGLRVPEDISIVGFDDQPEAAYFVPPLTSVNQGFAELGARCIQMLLSDMAGGRSE